MSLDEKLLAMGVSKELNWRNSRTSFDQLKGINPLSITVNKEDDYILFDLKDRVIVMMHDQDCCESVYIESIVGEISDLIGNEILLAEEVIDNGDSDYGTYTYTFYKLATVKGYVDIRWNGESNGYYSESVDIYSFMKS